MLDWIYPFSLGQKFRWYQFLRDEAQLLARDARFLALLRRATVPLPGLDVPREPRGALFPPLEVSPHPRLAGKRVGLVVSGGSGALVTLCGVKRALEEAGVEIAAVSVCSGGAIWGSMVAAGLSADEMVEASLGWEPSELVDVDWAALRGLPLGLGRGFTGFLRGEAIEAALDRALGGATLATAAIPYYAIVLDLETNTVEYFGPHNRPEASLARMVRVAVSLPPWVQPVRFGQHHYVDGGVVNIFPVDPLLDHEEPLDYVIGVNVIMPSGFRGESIEGWTEQPLSILQANRQFYHSGWLELARASMERAGERMILLEPLPHTEILGMRFFEIFLDTSTWPELILRAYDHTRERLAALAD